MIDLPSKGRGRYNRVSAGRRRFEMIDLPSKGRGRSGRVSPEGSR